MEKEMEKEKIMIKINFEGENLNQEKNGKGIIYTKAGEIFFIGGYLYGLRKKKGKEFINRHIAYEGEYLYNKKWNGKGYDENHKIIYELINGNRKVNKYNYDNGLLFEAKYLNVIRNGKGKEYIYGKLLFVGEYLNGISNGKGKEYNEDKLILIFEGKYLNGQRNEKGREYQYSYLEDIKRKRNKGKEYKYDKLLFEGVYINWQRNGKGKEYKRDIFDYSNKLLFEGEYFEW